MQPDLDLQYHLWHSKSKPKDLFGIYQIYTSDFSMTNITTQRNYHSLKLIRRASGMLDPELIPPGLFVQHDFTQLQWPRWIRITIKDKK